MSKKILEKIVAIRQSKNKALTVLLDPDKVNDENFGFFLKDCVQHHVDFFFLGGSLISNYIMAEMIVEIRKICQIPIILFPGNSLHIEPSADAILFLSLISGRNPDFLIGQHVVSAPLLKKSNLEILPTGYMLIDSGKATTVSYISNTTPIPHDKADVAAATAIAGEMLGLKLIYLDGGSGAIYPVSAKMIKKVRQSVDIPIIVGGGINSGEKAFMALQAGADIIVVGNAFEKNPSLLSEISQTVKSFNLSLAE